MMPFLHLGPWRIGTYGICLVTGFFIGYYVLRAELRRRGLSQIKPLEVVVVLCLSALLSSKLYFAVQHHELLLSHPALLFGRTGFTYYGGLLGDVVALIFLARRYAVPFLTLCDTLSVACALGYGIGRIGCFLAGDGDYGIVTSLPWGMSFPHGLVPTTQSVHPAPLYEFLTSALIAWSLWVQGARGLRGATGDPTTQPGEVFATFLLATGIARFLVEFIKRNPPVLFGLVNAQVVALVSMFMGIVLLSVLRRRGSQRPRPGSLPRFSFDRAARSAAASDLSTTARTRL